jgi:hypothetical protein
MFRFLLRSKGRKTAPGRFRRLHEVVVAVGQMMEDGSSAHPLIRVLMNALMGHEK